MQSESSFSKNEKLWVIVLSLIMMGLTTVAVVPSLRTKAKALIKSDGRHILAKVNGRATPESPRFTILKISEPEGLSLEIYTLEESSGKMILTSKIRLSEKRDAFFSFQGNATNLAFTDIDGDGSLEIVAPAYDDQMVARLNIFKYNPDTKNFDRMVSPEN